MKFSNVFAILSLSLINCTPILASPAGGASSNAQLGAGVAPIATQFYPGMISAIAKLSPDAAQKVEDAAKQACDAVKDINTSGADEQVAADAGSSFFSPITNTISSFVSSVLPTVAPVLEAIMAVTTGDASSAPKLVAIAQQTCSVVFK